MGALRVVNLIKKLEELDKRHIEEFIDNAVKEKENRMVELNLQQLESGINSLGRSIEPPYTPFTVAQKIRKGQPYDKVTLFDKGDFYRRFEAQRYKSKVEIVSNDSKEEALKNKYGEEIEGLTDGNLEIITEEMKPIIFKQVKSYFKL